MTEECSLVCMMKETIQPFERRLALLELESLASAKAAPVPTVLAETVIYRITTTQSPAQLLRRLAHWETVGLETESGRLTQHVLLESTANTVRDWITLEQLQWI